MIKYLEVDKSNCEVYEGSEALIYKTFAAGTKNPDTVHEVEDQMAKLWNKLKENHNGLYVKQYPQLQNNVPPVPSNEWVVHFSCAPKVGEQFEEDVIEDTKQYFKSLKL